MIYPFDPGAMLSHFYPLPDGSRVRLRLVQRRDEEAIRRLLVAAGTEPQDLAIKRLVGCDPRRRAVICATALIGANESLVGIGAIELDGRNDPMPDLLIVAGHADGCVYELLLGALRGRAGTVARARAA